MREDCRKEVLQLHQFFRDWFSGRLQEKDFGRCSAVLAESFQIITPAGELVERAELLRGLRSARGRFASRPLRLWIENYGGRSLAPGVELATYEEWQEHPSGKRGRLSTALFRRREGTPNRVEWLHVHEVWLAETTPTEPEP